MNQQLTFPAPMARRTDPRTSVRAAADMSPGNDDCVRAIRRYLAHRGPQTQEEIALALAPDERVSRWRRSTIVSACARAGLVYCGEDFNQRGRRVGVWGLPVENTRPL